MTNNFKFDGEEFDCKDKCVKVLGEIKPIIKSQDYHITIELEKLNSKIIHLNDEIGRVKDLYFDFTRRTVQDIDDLVKEIIKLKERK